MNMADETTSEKCETLYNKLNTFVESEISRDVTPQISNLNSRIDALEPNLVRVKEVNGNISSVSAGGTSTKTFTVPACPSGYSWKYLSTSTGWGTVSNVSLSGTTLTVTLLNVSNTSHDISFSGVLMYYPKTIEAEPHISLTATNPYLLSGEVTDLVVSLVDEFGLPLNNKNVTIEQSVFIDDGTTATHYDHWYINSYGTATVQSDGTKLLHTSGNNFVMRSIIPSNKTITEPNAYSYNPPYIVEFDIVETDGTSNSNAQVQIYSDQTTNNFAQALTTGHYKIEVTSEEQKIWLDDTLIKTTNFSLPNARITFRVRNGKYLIYKNFKVYEIINGVTDGNGEFALHNVSVTDDTTFIANYGTETASCFVEYCDFVDYAVTNNKNNTWYNNVGGIITVDDNGTTLTSVPHSNGTHWVSGYCPASTTTAKPFSYPIIVEFDILQWDYGSSIFIKSDLGNRTSFNRELNHIGSRAKIEIGTTSTKIYIDGAFVSEKTYTQPSNYGIELGAYVSKSDSPTAPSLKFANLTIRPL